MQFVDEYKNIDRYIEELEEEGTWKIMFRRILENYTKGNQVEITLVFAHDMGILMDILVIFLLSTFL